MTIQNFKTTPFAAHHSADSRERAQRSKNPHTVPVREMAAPVRSAIGLEDMQDAHEIARLLAMPFPIFAQTVARLLETLGYDNVQTMKAMHKRGKGRNAHGGYDLRMYLPTPLTHGLVIAQVKQYKEPVPRSFVDELRGTMLRLGARQGLLVTTSTFSASAVEAVQGAQYAAPVRLMDGRELARLLRTHPESSQPVTNSADAPARTIAVPSPASNLWSGSRQRSDRLEPEFLDGQGIPPDETAPASKPTTSGQEGVTLTVRVAVCLAPAAPCGKTADEHGTAVGERGRP